MEKKVRHLSSIYELLDYKSQSGYVTSSDDLLM